LLSCTAISNCRPNNAPLMAPKIPSAPPPASTKPKNTPSAGPTQITGITLPPVEFVVLAAIAPACPHLPTNHGTIGRSLAAGQWPDAAAEPTENGHARSLQIIAVITAIHR